MGQDTVLSMTIGAVWRIGILLKVGLAVPAFEIVFSDLGVTVGAVRSSDSLTWTMFLRIDISVTLHTWNISMHRILNVLLVDRHGNLLSFNSLDYILFFVTDKTFLVGRAQHQAFSFQFVGMMAVGASRYGPRFLFPELAFNDLDMDFFNSGMAFGACAGHISSRDS